MDATEASERAQRLTDEALSEAGLEDPRPGYRKLLLHLKGLDAAAFEEATHRFNETLVPDVASGSVAALEAWLAYARWLCERIRAGRIVAIDGSGRATDGAETLAADTVLIHLPDEPAAPAIVLATPSRPTPSQKATVELLAR
jgi:hypothetical protein